jgi:hypothetical protein
MKPSSRIRRAVSRVSPVVRGDVVDGQDGQAVAFLDGLELAEQPFPIGCLDLLVAPGPFQPWKSDSAATMKTLSRTRGMISKPRLRISLIPG